MFGFYGISTFVGYLMPNPFYTKTVLFQTIHFSISTVELPKTFLFQAIQFIQTVLIQTIQFSVSTVLMSKTVQFKTIQFSISTQLTCQNSSIPSNSV